MVGCKPTYKLDAMLLFVADSVTLPLTSASRNFWLISLAYLGGGGGRV